MVVFLFHVTSRTYIVGDKPGPGRTWPITQKEYTLLKCRMP